MGGEGERRSRQEGEARQGTGGGEPGCASWSARGRRQVTPGCVGTKGHKAGRGRCTLHPTSSASLRLSPQKVLPPPPRGAPACSLCFQVPLLPCWVPLASPAALEVEPISASPVPAPLHL